MVNTHSARLERWLGKEQVENISRAMRGSHTPYAIPVANVPGHIYVRNDGEFVGKIRGGYYADLMSYLWEKSKRIEREIHMGFRRNLATANQGFTSISDLISEATVNGKAQFFIIAKAGSTGVVATANDLFYNGTMPVAGTVAAAPGGASLDNTTVGGLIQSNPGGSDKLFFGGGMIAPTVANNTLLMYDRIFHVNHNIATDPQTISGVPTRHQDATAAGLFIFCFVTTALGAGTPTITLSYTDQGGGASVTAATTLIASAILRRFPFTVGNGWFIPLAAGDTGVRALTNSDMSAASTGILDYVIARPLVFIPQRVAGDAFPLDPILSSWLLREIPASACLSFCELSKGATTATNYNGTLMLVSG